METSSAFNAFQVLLFYEIKLENVPYRLFLIDWNRALAFMEASRELVLIWDLTSSQRLFSAIDRFSAVTVYPFPVCISPCDRVLRIPFSPGKKDASILLILPVNGSYDLFKRINGFSSAFESICVLIWLPFKARSFEKRWDIDVSSRICCFLFHPCTLFVTASDVQKIRHLHKL